MNQTLLMLGSIFIFRKDLGVGGGSEKGNFSLLYLMKMSLRKRGVSGSKEPQKTRT